MAEREARDLVGDPQYYGIDQDKGDPSDPEYWSPERVENRNKFREWANKQQDAAEQATILGAQQGMDADSVLSKLGFADRKDQGKYIWNLYGNNGLFATQGGAVDPNLDYDWARGIKTWKPGTDNAGKSMRINDTERQMYDQAQQQRGAGLKGWGQMQNANKFAQIRDQHFGKDPKTGLYWNIPQNGGNGMDPSTWQWKDQYGRTVAAPKGDLGYLVAQAQGGDPSGLPQYGQQGQDQNQDRGLPQVPGGQGGDYMSLLNGGGTAQPYTNSVPAPQNVFNNQQMRQEGAAAKATDAASPYQKLITGGAKKQPAAQSMTLGGF